MTVFQKVFVQRGIYDVVLEYHVKGNELSLKQNGDLVVIERPVFDDIVAAVHRAEADGKDDPRASATEYVILETGGGPQALARMVNLFIGKGYRPVGGPFAIPVSRNNLRNGADYETRVCQAMAPADMVQYC